jgi:hypothetical protein
MPTSVRSPASAGRPAGGRVKVCVTSGALAGSASARGRDGKRVPQRSQNRLPGAFSAPQAGQVSASLPAEGLPLVVTPISFS